MTVMVTVSPTVGRSGWRRAWAAVGMRRCRYLVRAHAVGEAFGVRAMVYGAAVGMDEPVRLVGDGPVRPVGHDVTADAVDIIREDVLSGC